MINFYNFSLNFLFVPKDIDLVNIHKYDFYYSAPFQHCYSYVCYQASINIQININLYQYYIIYFHLIFCLFFLISIFLPQIYIIYRHIVLLQIYLYHQPNGIYIIIVHHFYTHIQRDIYFCGFRQEDRFYINYQYLQFYLLFINSFSLIIFDNYSNILIIFTNQILFHN